MKTFRYDPTKRIGVSLVLGKAMCGHYVWALARSDRFKFSKCYNCIHEPSYEPTEYVRLRGLLEVATK